MARDDALRGVCGASSVRRRRRDSERRRRRDSERRRRRDSERRRRRDSERLLRGHGCGGLPPARTARPTAAVERRPVVRRERAWPLRVRATAQGVG